MGAQSETAEVWILVDVAEERDVSTQILGVYPSPAAAVDALPGLCKAFLVTVGATVEIQLWRGSELVSSEKVQASL